MRSIFCRPRWLPISYLKKHDKTANSKQWLKTVFYAKNNRYPYLFVGSGLALYFLIHIAVSGHPETALPFYTLFLSLPGGLVIGGLEEAGWMYPLQPELDKKDGVIRSSVLVGCIWILWHIPLFFISGTNHGEGLINFWMFAVQLIAFRFFNGAIYKLSGKSRVFMCVLFHTIFNAASPDDDLGGNDRRKWRDGSCFNHSGFLKQGKKRKRS